MDNKMDKRNTGEESPQKPRARTGHSEVKGKKSTVRNLVHSVMVGAFLSGPALSASGQNKNDHQPVRAENASGQHTVNGDFAAKGREEVKEGEYSSNEAQCEPCMPPAEPCMPPGPPIA